MSLFRKMNLNHTRKLRMVRCLNRKWKGTLTGKEIERQQGLLSRKENKWRRNTHHIRMIQVITNSGMISNKSKRNHPLDPQVLLETVVNKLIKTPLQNVTEKSTPYSPISTKTPTLKSLRSTLLLSRKTHSLATIERRTSKGD